MDKVEIRHATKSDLDGVLAIFNHEIVSDVMAWDIDPIEGSDREQWFEPHSQPEYPLLVAEANSGIVGWASLSRWAHHGAYDRTVETSVYVHQNERGHGIGRSLLMQLINESKKAGHHVLIARSDASNEASRQLHLRAGFRSVGIMHQVGFKFGLFLDAELFELLLD
jgi:phosphinothricin acetyltransferase